MGWRQPQLYVHHYMHIGSGDMSAAAQARGPCNRLDCKRERGLVRETEADYM